LCIRECQAKDANFNVSMRIPSGLDMATSDMKLESSSTMAQLMNVIPQCLGTMMLEPDGHGQSSEV
jgi:hypothetical protein